MALGPGDVCGRTFPEDDLKSNTVLIRTGVRALVREGALTLKVVFEAGKSSDKAAREGASQLLASALHAEVAAYIEAHAELLDADGHRLVVRNGSHEPREVMNAAGAVPFGRRGQ